MPDTQQLSVSVKGPSSLLKVTPNIVFGSSVAIHETVLLIPGISSAVVALLKVPGNSNV